MLVDHFCFWSWYLNQIFKVHICRFTFISPIMPTLKIIVASRALHENRLSWGWLCVDGNPEFLFIAFRTFNSTMWLNLFTNLVNKSSKLLITVCLRRSLSTEISSGYLLKLIISEKNWNALPVTFSWISPLRTHWILVWWSNYNISKNWSQFL